MSSEAKLHKASSVVGTIVRRSAMVLSFPFTFLWFFLISWKPGLKKIWNPDPIKVYIVGRDLKVEHHGVVRVMGSPRYRKQRVVRGGIDQPSIIVATGLLQNPSFEYAIRVDRPEALKRPSHAVIKQIKQKFERLGFEIQLITLYDGEQEIVVLP